VLPPKALPWEKNFGGDKVLRDLFYGWYNINEVFINLIICIMAVKRNVANNFLQKEVLVAERSTRTSTNQPNKKKPILISEEHLIDPGEAVGNDWFNLFNGEGF